MPSLRRAPALLGALAVLATACGGAAPPSGTRVTAAAAEAARALTPAPGPGHAPAAVPGPADRRTGAEIARGVPATPIPDEVSTVTSDVVVHTGPLGAADIAAAEGTDGVEALAAASRLDAAVEAPSGVRRGLIVLAVDPATFRPFTPDVTAQAPGVWQRLVDGDIVLRHDVAHDLGVQLGDVLEVRGPSATLSLRVGALASNGAPPLADAVVLSAIGRELGAPGPNELVLSTTSAAEAQQTGDAVLDAVGGAGSAEVRDAPEQQHAGLVGTSVDFESFRYTDLGDGMIVIDPAWVARWIVTVELPRVGRTRVHRLLAPQLLAAMRELDELGLIDHLDPEQFGGGWVPRHIDWEPSKPLSMHAWGLAVDLNTHDNGLGETPTMDPRVVEVFEHWGFEWGGRWARPDGMHFELAQLVDVGA